MRHSRASLEARLDTLEDELVSAVVTAFWPDAFAAIMALPTETRNDALRSLAKLNQDYQLDGVPVGSTVSGGFAVVLQCIAQTAPEVAQALGTRWALMLKRPEQDQSADVSPDQATNPAAKDLPGMPDGGKCRTDDASPTRIEGPDSRPTDSPRLPHVSAIGLGKQQELPL